MRGLLDERHESEEEGARFGDGLVHLPVASDYTTAHSGLLVQKSAKR
jgi:hypothetical protein